MSINNLNTYLNIKDSHLRVVSGNVYAQAMNIGGINVETAHGLQSVSNTGNVTSNTLQFSNAITGFVTTANAQIGRDLIVSGNATVSTDLTVSANATVADTLTISEHVIASKEATVTGNLHVTTIRSDSNVVAEYTGPHDRPLRKYPEVALTSASDSGYVVTRSSENTASQHYAWELFDNNSATKWLATSGDSYSTTSPFLYNGTNNSTVIDVTNTPHNGAWVKLQLPVSIKLSHVIQRDNDNPSHRVPGVVTFLGSNNGSDWTFLKEFTGLSNVVVTETMYVNSTVAYSHYAYVVKNLSDADGQLDLGGLEYYGHEEGSGSLDTTLKTVYNVPATTGTQLEVYYDAKGESTVQSPIPDLSPNTNTGALSTSPPTLDSTDGIDSFKFDASSSQNITSTIDTSYWGTNKLHSVAFWFKADTINGKFNIFHIGNPAASESSGFWISEGSADSNSGNSLSWWFYGGDSTLKTSSFSWALDTWYHIALTFDGSTKKLYVNGKHTDYSVGNVITTLPTGIPASASLAVGSTTNSVDYFDGSIANFRVYGAKVLNADQIKELYDYQKDYFLGSKSQVTLYKGHLGVGVAEPSGQLELAGDERIQEYPPRAMTGWETYMEGHGVFRAGKSGHDDYLGAWDRWKVFNKGFTTSGGTAGDSYHGEQSYSSSTGLYTGVGTQIERLGGIFGDYFILDMPYKISLKHINVTSSNQSRSPAEFIILGSNDGSTWTQIKHFSSAFTGSGQTLPFQVNSNEYFSYFGLVVTKIVASDGYLMLSEWQLFGTPGPTTLDKGSLTLGRSLDVPRVSRYDVDTETPRPEKLVVDFDTTVNSSPTDISGKGNHGVFYSSASYSAPDKAFNFSGWSGDSPAGTEDWIQTTATGTSGNFIHSVSMWVKSRVSSTSTTSRTAFHMGNASVANQEMQIQFNYNANTVYLGTQNGWLTMSNMEDIIKQNQWHHIAYTYNGTNMLPANTKFYIDGKQMTMGSGSSSTLSFPSSTEDVFLGKFNSSGSPNWWNGQISNFKLYNVALEPSEVKKLYNLGRTGRSMVISDTAVGIGKVPEAQLDVRGNISCDGVFRSKNPIAFEAYYTDGTLSTTGTYLPNIVRYNYGGCYELSTGRFYAPINGIYAFHWHAYTNQGDSTSRIFIDVNGSDRGQKGNTVKDMGQQLSFSIYLNAGDYLIIKGKSAYPLYFHGHLNHNMYSGHLVIAM